MKTFEKINIKRIKEDIKELVEKQKFFKNQRKTINLKEDRVISPSEATWKHQLNREKLRCMYAAYGLSRGKTFSQIENNHIEENHPLFKYLDKISLILSKYKEKKVVVEEVEQ